MSTPYQFSVANMPHLKALMEATQREVMLTGAFGSGKSRGGCEKGYFLSQKYPGNKGLIIRKTYASLRHTTMDTWRRYVCPPSAIKSFNQETHLYTLTNGSEILFLGLKDDQARIGSLEVGWIFIDEAIEFTEPEYTMLLGRLRYNQVPFRQIFMATNPGSPQHFLYQRFFIDSSSDRLAIPSCTLDNPHNPQDYVDSLMALTGTYYERYVMGRWVGFEGLVYDNIDLDILLIDRFDIPHNWTRYRTIDFGYTNPFVCQWWAQCPKDDEYYPEYAGHWFMYREIYRARTTVDNHAAMIKSYREDISVTICDHDAEDRATLEERGIYTHLANKEVSPGIQTVYGMMEQGVVHIFRDALIGGKDPQLVEEHRPTQTIEEFGNYRWMELKQDRNIKEVPVDRDNHGMDAMRYLFHTLLSVHDSLDVHFDQRETWHENRNWEGQLIRNRRYKELG